MESDSLRRNLELPSAVPNASSLAAYKDFLALGKDADPDPDPDLPILKEPKAEYAKLR